MKFFTSLFFLLVFPFSLHAQTTLSGKVTEAEDGSELIGANIKIFKDGVFRTGASTDFDGNYSVELASGVYDVEVSYIGYSTNKITGLVIKANQDTKLNVEFKDTGNRIKLDYVVSMCCLNIPLISQDEMTKIQITEDYNIKNLPSKNIREISAYSSELSLDRF